MTPSQHAKVLEALEFHIEAALCSDDGMADRIMHMDKARKQLAAYREALSIMRAEGVEQRPAIRAATYVTGPQGGKASFHFDCPEEGEAWFERLLAECPAPPTEHEVKP